MNGHPVTTGFGPLCVCRGGVHGHPADGKVFVLPVETAGQVRTGKEGVEAV